MAQYSDPRTHTPRAYLGTSSGRVLYEITADRCGCERARPEDDAAGLDPEIYCADCGAYLDVDDPACGNCRALESRFEALRSGDLGRLDD